MDENLFPMNLCILMKRFCLKKVFSLNVIAATSLICTWLIPIHLKKSECVLLKSFLYLEIFTKNLNRRIFLPCLWKRVKMHDKHRTILSSFIFSDCLWTSIVLFILWYSVVKTQFYHWACFLSSVWIHSNRDLFLFWWNDSSRTLSSHHSFTFDNPADEEVS